MSDLEQSHTVTFPLWVFGVSRLGIQYWSQRRAGRTTKAAPVTMVGR